MPPTIQGIYDDGIYGGSATYRNNPLALINNAGYTKIINELLIST